jgi:hypothetical protein
MTHAYYKEQTSRLELDYERTAWLAANIMNASGNLKRPVTVDRLLGKKDNNRQYKRFRSAEERERELNKILEKFNKRQGG